MTKRQRRHLDLCIYEASSIAVTFSCFLLLIASAGASESIAADESEHKLSLPIQLRLRNAPLRDVLSRLSQATDQAIFVDRRVDPSVRIELEFSGKPLRDVLRAAAEQAECETAMLGSIVYFGPPQSARCLPELAVRCRHQIQTIPTHLRKKYLHEATTHWKRLAQPREVVNQMLRKQGLRLEDTNAIPHDLWPAGTLPEAPLADRLTLLLIGFELEWFPTPDNPRKVGVKQLQVRAQK